MFAKMDVEGRNKLGVWDSQIHTAAAKSLQSCPTL